MDRIILFELNEVPYKVVDHFCLHNPDSTLASLMPSLRQYESYSEDASHLLPWRTWPTVHRGVIDDQHRLYDFGQDLTEIDRTYPPLWKILTKNGIKTGVFGSLHSYPMPKSLENYVFYFPDTFASDSRCFPQVLSYFQALNLEMSRESARNVTRCIPWKSALMVAARSGSLGLKLRTYGQVANHVLSEQIRNWKRTRRRTYQAVLAFDVFMKQLMSGKPEFATFYTNHVASSMHRYWAACFPEDYDHSEFSEHWMNTYSGEIDFAMSCFDRMLGVLVEFVEHNPEYVLWITSSMGQEATIAKPLRTQLYVKELGRFMACLGLEDTEWEKRPSMLPDYNFVVHEEKAEEFRGNLKLLSINGAGVHWVNRGNNFFRINLGHSDLDKKSTTIRLGERYVSLESMGLDVTRIEDESGTTAYHVPNGILLIHDPKTAVPWSRGRPSVSTLEIAPAILDNYAIQRPPYMKAPVSIQ